MIEFEEGGHTYRTGALNVMEQFHVARRSAPVLGPAIAVMGALSSIEDAIVPLSEAVAKLSDADSEYIIFTCCKTVERKDSGAWAKIFNVSSKLFMYPDINLRNMIVITANVIKDNLGDFFPASLPASQEQESPPVMNP